MHFLIVDGYPRASRDEFDQIGMKKAYDLYSELLLRHSPDASFDVLTPSDDDVDMPSDLNAYKAVLWTGCNLTVYAENDARVQRMLDLADESFSKSIPAFGSCWALQIAVIVAGGEVAPNPRGKEMGIARTIRLTADGMDHPMYAGKPAVFDAFISHDDMVTKLPNSSMLLSGNDWTRVQSAEIVHKGTPFWALQYHPEYNLHEMARLMVARKKRMMELNFFDDEASADLYVKAFEKLHLEPQNKSLRWILSIDDQVIEPKNRELEFANFIKFIST